MAFWAWSKTAASNATADSTINWAEGQAPASINDSARAAMARTAEWRDDISGTITTSGTSTAYTVASNQVFDTLAHMANAMIAFVPHATNGATVTLNVDSLGAKPLRYGPSLELQTGTLIQGTPYVATYNNSDAVFYLQGLAANPYGVPLGGLLPYTGSTAPNSAFVLSGGQTLSRTIYATYFALVGTTYGIGDGSTTFTIPDLRGRAIFGLDNPLGSPAGRISVAGGNFSPVLGGTGGFENHTLTQSELSVNLGTASTSVTVSQTNVYQGANNVAQSGTGANSPATIGALTASATTTITNPLGGNAHTIMPPSIVLAYILRVI